MRTKILCYDVKVSSCLLAYFRCRSAPKRSKCLNLVMDAIVYKFTTFRHFTVEIVDRESVHSEHLHLLYTASPGPRLDLVSILNTGG